MTLVSFLTNIKGKGNLKNIALIKANFRELIKVDVTLIKFRFRFVFVLGFYFTLSIVQPLLHTHTTDPFHFVHVHLDIDKSQNDFSEHSDHSGPRLEKEHLATGADNSLPSPGTSHLVVDGSSLATYHAIQQVDYKITPSIPAPPVDFLTQLPPITQHAISIDEHNHIRNKTYIITSLTDLSPPLA